MEPEKRLGSDQRIRRQTTFKRLIERGRFARGEYFYLWVESRDKGGRAALRQKPMIGIAVSKKTDPTAVGRNFWKRRVREIFRGQQSQLRPEAVCLVKVRRAQTRPSFSAAEEDLIKLFKKAGAWA